MNFLTNNKSKILLSNIEQRMPIVKKFFFGKFKGRGGSDKKQILLDHIFDHIKV